MSTITAPRRRNRRGEGDQLRAVIVRAAEELLDAGGTERDITLRGVARQAGISAPSIYPHFAHVDAILLAVVQAAFETLRQALKGAGGEGRDGSSADPADPLGRLRAVCEAYLGFARERPLRYRVMFAGVWQARLAVEADPSLAGEAAALGADAFAVLVDAVSDCAASGDSGSRDPASDASALWVGLHGLASLQHAAPLFPWPPTITEDLITRLALLRPR